MKKWFVEHVSLSPSIEKSIKLFSVTRGLRGMLAGVLFSTRTESVPFTESTSHTERYRETIVRSVHGTHYGTHYRDPFGTLDELRQSRNKFYENFGFPNAIGCIDCTHIAIVPPKKNDLDQPEHTYVNRKRYHSLNMQLVCDADMKIINANARYPGSSHDCLIWNDSNLLPLMKRICEMGNERFYLLGDSGYPLRKWLMTPFKEHFPNTPEEQFNNVFCLARSLIEQVNGLLTMKFRCLLKHRVLHYDPTTAAKIVNTCRFLHNKAVMDRMPLDREAGDDQLNNDDLGIIDYEELDELNPPPMARVNPELAAGRTLRQQIVRMYYQ